VVRIVTPGTVFESGLLRGDQNNYLVGVAIGDGRVGIAYADVTTGEFSAAELAGSDVQGLVRAELSRLNPAEVLLPEGTFQPRDFSGHVTALPAWRFDFTHCTEVLLRQFNVAVLDGFGLHGKPHAVRASGAILQYLQETQPSTLKLFSGMSTYSLDDFMALDGTARRTLELTETMRRGEEAGSLLKVLDHTITPMGKRLLRQWVSKPLLELGGIHQRQEQVACLVANGLARAATRSDLKKLHDLERLTNRVISGHASPRDLSSIRVTLDVLPSIQDLSKTIQGPINSLLEKLSSCADVLDLVQKAVVDDPPPSISAIGIIRPGFSSELDQILESSQHARDWINNLESSERERTGIKTLKVGFNKVFGYYIEITHSNTSTVPADFIRKQTLVNAERYITPALKEYETLILNAEDRIHEVELRVFREVCAQISLSSAELLENARALAELDVLISLAEAAVLNNYQCPEVVEGNILDIRDGRHPVVEHTITDGRFIPNDTVFENEEIVRIITGPNMSGKSTFLRQTALIVLMAQMGSFVPAASARIGLVDRIFTRIGAQDEIHAGQSTFMVEMIETANILNHATARSLLILDEIGRGTSTYDGVSIAWAVIEFIHNHPGLRARTLFATHYHELTQMADLLPGVRNYNVAVTESGGSVVFLHRIVPGGADRSYGIHVAQLAGLPRTLIQRASEILNQLETSSGKAVSSPSITPRQMALFPETNPLLEELEAVDINTLSPLEALNKLFEWRSKFTDTEGK
jgi:DNA mismatch repair protein MutS